ncbi:MAG: ribonuclease Y [Candidatus Peregrinibacteria bacterium]|nr:ribonuclease Y [Candidatus Peregrinibacteria bacterium]
MQTIIYILIGLVVGAAGIWFYFKLEGSRYLKKIEDANERKIAQAQKRLVEIEQKAAVAETKLKEKIIDAKNRALEIVEEAKKEEQSMRRQLEKQEERLISKEDTLEKKTTEVEKAREDLHKKEESIRVQEEKVEAIYKEQEEKLAKITQLSKEEARQMLLNNMERDYKDELVDYYNKLKEEAKEESRKEATNVIAAAIQKIAADVTSESTQTIVEIPNDDIKGRVIGKEGRNINAFEHLTGVDVIVDDTPNAIMISGFDLVRRYVAKRSLEKLVEDGRIHPARIESVVEEVKEQVHQMMKEFGEKAAFEMGITGLHPDLIKIIGRLRFRTSYGQNVIKHSMEVGFLAGHMASSIGADPHVAKVAGFLHDIGKAVDHEVEGSHALIGADILRKYGLQEEIVHAVEAHHEEVPVNTAEALVVQAADAISAARPGARSETVETYLKRLRELEQLTTSFDGVEKAYAIQAGREVRVFVKPDKVDDLKAIQLSHDIARKIEQELAYPGTIKVQVIRETRATEVAK